MHYTTLGNTDIKVSRICVGGMSFGRVSERGHQWLLDQDACTEMIGHALDLGVNFIDTANTYAGGTSEEFPDSLFASCGWSSVQKNMGR